MKEVQLEKGKLIVSKWRKDGKESIKGIKLSMQDDTTMATVFMSLEECEKLIVSLFKEKKEVVEGK